MRRIHRLLLTGLLLAHPLGACTTTYTESEMAAQELKRDKEDRREERTDQQVDEEEGGANAEQLGRDAQEVDQDSDL